MAKRTAASGAAGVASSAQGASSASGRPKAALPLGELVVSVLRVAYRSRRPVLLEGPTGIGKSEIVAQAASELGVGYQVLDLSLLEPPDLVGLPVIEGGRTTFASPLALPQDGAGILMLEELNRAERYIQQPALQLLTARRLHQYELPPGWMTCAAINPEHGEYQVTPLDPALRSRFLNLQVRSDRGEWLRWARAHDVHPAVLELAGEHDRILEDTPPRTWAYVSQLLHSMSPDDFGNARLLHATLNGYLPTAWTEVLIAKLEAWSSSDGVDVPRLLRLYHEDETLRQFVSNLIAQGRTDALEMIAFRALEIVGGPELARLIGRGEFKLEAFERLIRDLPGDLREQLQDEFGRQLAALPLLNFRAELVMVREYGGSGLSATVKKLVGEPLMRHRVQLMVAAVCRHLETDAKVFELRRNVGAQMALGLFLQHVGRFGDPLRETARKLQLELKAPK